MTRKKVRRTKGPSVVWLAWWDTPNLGTLWFGSRKAAEAYVHDLPNGRIAGPYRAVPHRSDADG